MKYPVVFLLFLSFAAVANNLVSAHSSHHSISEAVGDEVWSASVDTLGPLRVRRDTDEKGKDKSDVEIHHPHKLRTWCFCGKKSWLDTFMSKNKENVETCVKQYLPLLNRTENEISERPSAIFPAILKMSTCSNECIFKKGNLVKSDGKLDKNATRKYFLDNVFQEKWMKGLSGKVMDKCLTTGSAFPEVETFIRSNADSESCNYEPYEFVICLMLEMTNDCPKDQLSEDFGCKLLYGVMDILKPLEETTINPRNNS